MKSIIKILVFISLFVSATSCNYERINELENQVSDLELQIEEYENRLSDIARYIDEMEAAVLELRSEFDDLGHEDWRYFINDMHAAINSVEFALYDLQSVAY